MLIFQLFVCAGLKDVVNEVVVHSSLVCLIITSRSEHSLHLSLTEVQGSHFIQGFAHIQPPDQVSTHTYANKVTGIVISTKPITCALLFTGTESRHPAPFDLKEVLSV